MPALSIVGRVFTVDEFYDYLQKLQWGSWRPKFVTMHHTASPDFRTWQSYKARNISFEQWLRNLANYYGNHLGWRSGPHFFSSPDGRVGVLSSPTSIGVHAVQFNRLSWGLEVVGYFDRGGDKFDGVARDTAVGALAAMHLAMGWEPGDYRHNARGLHFHRDDTTTSKTCPGNAIDKADVVRAVESRMQKMLGAAPADDTHDTPAVPVAMPARRGTVKAPDGFLNVRADPSAKSPVLRRIANGDVVSIQSEAWNGSTKWLRIGPDDWVSAAFVVTA